MLLNDYLVKLSLAIHIFGFFIDDKKFVIKYDNKKTSLFQDPKLIQYKRTTKEIKLFKLLTSLPCIKVPKVQFSQKTPENTFKVLEKTLYSINEPYLSSLCTDALKDDRKYKKVDQNDSVVDSGVIIPYNIKNNAIDNCKWVENTQNECITQCQANLIIKKLEPTWKNDINDKNFNNKYASQKTANIFVYSEFSYNIKKNPEKGQNFLGCSKILQPKDLLSLDEKSEQKILDSNILKSGDGTNLETDEDRQTYIAKRKKVMFKK